jgi:branched-chain amino acid transport system substrate-binding protein
MVAWNQFMDKYMPQGDKKSSFHAYGYSVTASLVEVLKKSGDNLTRENVMKQAANLKDFDTGMSLPGIKINTGPKDFAPIQAVQLMRFDGKSWVRFGDVISADSQ